MLELHGVRKSYGARQAVKGISFAIRAGETLGLLGPNGAGKTTTVSMIAGLITPDSGEVKLDGRSLAGDTDPLKARIGLVPQDLALFEDLSARENLFLFGALYGLQGAALEGAAAETLAFTGLADRAKDKVKTFSGGMKRRLNLAAALLHDPDLIILDEPTVGVDPQSRNAIFEGLETLKARGKTLLYTTHYMEEAERLCDRIVIVDHGEVIADDTVAGLTRRLPLRNVLRLEVEDPPPGAWADELATLPGIVSARLEAEVLTLGLAELGPGSAAALGWLTARGIAIAHAHTERPDLETVFLALTGRTMRDA
ncbi:ABC transporter ATP-binding protein [Geothrix sp. 21YS21S-2]|uniref:ABC transporter ATP-binding protein n=1 Tax=Geothrix sp. 21YS21S-2 TaxID=3068893 RepID=UPI0027BA29B8|nr:ABC transporter ATP-binding protein [Geothrix sp. 21YS21S-2]